MKLLMREKMPSVGDDSWVQDESGDAKITKKWVRVRETYGIEIGDGEDVPPRVAIAVAIESLAR
jgi:uncharacterized protein YxjI